MQNTLFIQGMACYLLLININIIIISRAEKNYHYYLFNCLLVQRELVCWFGFLFLSGFELYYEKIVKEIRKKKELYAV